MSSNNNNTGTKRIELTEKQLKNIPGYSTTKETERLRGMTIGLLASAGVKNHALLNKDDVEYLMFELVIPTRENDVKRVIHFKIEVPRIYRKFTKKGMESRHEEAASWRLMYDYLDRKLAMVRLGVSDIMEEFTANIVMQLPNGQQQTVYEAMMEGVNDPNTPMLSFISEADR